MLVKPLGSSDVPLNHILSPESAREQLKEAFGSGRDFATWLGHCTFLIRLKNDLILTDPFLKGNAGPFFVRGLRRLPMPFDVNEIEPSLILISHIHLDHLHPKSMRGIKNKDTPVICPTNVEGKVHKLGFKNVTPLDWFESVSHQTLGITALPAHHYSEPILSKSLWASFKVKATDGKSVFFSGDTGYSAVFKKHVRQHGPFDVGFMGVGSYYNNSPTTQTHLVHTNPAEALQIAKDIRVKKVIGMHWGTARTTDESQKDIPAILKRNSDKTGIPAQTLRIGETIFI
jgi:L-ascorbate metabolism protein UlaG (beta-lactamase superfamily)